MLVHPVVEATMNLLEVGAKTLLPRVEMLRRKLGLFNDPGWSFSASTTLLEQNPNGLNRIGILGDREA